MDKMNDLLKTGLIPPFSKTVIRTPIYTDPENGIFIDILGSTLMTKEEIEMERFKILINLPKKK